MLVVHDWLKEYLGKNIPSSKEIEELLTFHSFEIEGVEKKDNQEVIDVDVLPNRSSDCLSHLGIAREIAVVTNTKLEHDPFLEKPSLPVTGKITVAIADPEGCRRFGAALVTGIKVKESPDWLKERLIAIGQRPINNVVDATNYIMFSLGQPLHAYDAGKFPQEKGVWQFGVRFAKDGEKITTLGGEEYVLDNSIQLIEDNGSNMPVGIAGIKGGSCAEVDDTTTAIILEAANFDPTITRKASQKLKLQTDASKRFENEVSREVIPHALSEAVRLIEDIAGGACEGYLDEYPTKSKNHEVRVTLSHINALLGLTLMAEEVEKILTQLGFTYTVNEEEWTITPPFERTDICIAVDVIEEIGRIYGYEHITSVTPTAVPLSEYNARQYYSEKIRDVLTDLGFSEVITSSFRKKDEVRLANALASDKGYLRGSLRKNIIEVLDKNIGNMDLLGLPDVRVFEIGTVFSKGEETIDEHVSVGLGIRTKQQGYNSKDDAALEEVIKKLESVLDVTIDHEIEKGVLEFNLSGLLSKLPTPEAYKPHSVSKEKQYKPFSTFPFVTRDIALWVKDAVGEDPAKEVEAVLNEMAGDLCVRVTLFDTFEKDGRTSYAFRLVFQSDSKTLTDSEIEPVMTAVYKAVEGRGWEVR